MSRMLSIMLAVACAILLPGAVDFDESGTAPDAALENGLEVDRNVRPDQEEGTDRPEEASSDEPSPVPLFSAMQLKDPAARWIVTIAVTNDVRTIKAGDMIDLMAPAVGDAAGLLPDPPPPSDEEILQGLPTKDRAGEVTRDNVRIDVEQLANRLGEARVFPMVGVAQVHSRHYKCTVHSRKTAKSDSPASLEEIQESSEVVYIDLNRLVLPIGRPVAENVQVVGTKSDRGALESGDRLLIAVTGAQVLKLKAASASTTLYVRSRASK